MKKAFVLLSAMAILSLAACGNGNADTGSNASGGSKASTPASSSAAGASSAAEGSAASEEGTGEGSVSTEVTTDSEEEGFINVTFSITVHNLGTRELWVAGNFSDPAWGDGMLQLEHVSGDVYSWENEAEAGTAIEYKYIVKDGAKLEWDTLNVDNRTFTYEAGVTTKDDGEHSLNVVSDEEVTVTFTVSGVTTEVGQAVYICCADNNWTPVDDYKLATADNGATWSKALTRNAGTILSFKFVIATEADGSGQTWELDGQGNRDYTFAVGETSYTAVWNVK